MMMRPEESKKAMRTVVPQKNALLTKHIRLTIYSYLGYEQCIK